MKVVVRFHAVTYPSVRAWRQTLGETEVMRTIQYTLFVNYLKDQFRQSHGFPPGTRIDASTAQGTYVWRVSHEVEVRYQVRERPRPARGWWDVSRTVMRLLKPIVRKVIIVGWETRRRS